MFRCDVERALAHGYDEARVVGKKDATLVKSTVQWYEKHKHDRGMGAVLLTDPFLILTDAYSKSRTPAARKNIASALRRGLRGLGVGGKTDDDFIANAARWYAQHKYHLEVNGFYMDGSGEEHEEQLFFLERSAEERR